MTAPGQENSDWSTVGGGRDIRLQHSPAKCRISSVPQLYQRRRLKLVEQRLSTVSEGYQAFASITA